jgi:leucyl aminopeptidase (aminopeptidase T)
MGVWDWKDSDVKRASISILDENLCISKDDFLLILTDTYKERIGEILFHVANEKGTRTKHVTYQPTGESGREPPMPVWKAAFGEDFLSELISKDIFNRIERKEITESDEEEIKELLLETTIPSNLPTVIIAINQYSISHTLFRKLCTDFLTMRFASMPLFEDWMFYTSMQANWKKVAERSNKVAKLLTDADSAFITCPLGTEIEIGLVERVGLADTGRFCNPGDFGNLPAGEAFIAPLEGTANGKFVTLWAPSRKLEKPTTFTVKNGKVVEVTGDGKLKLWLDNVFHREENASNIAELGIGTNGKAERFDNILEAEKILGTCHIAIGDNSSFGGSTRANIHVDFVIQEPTLILRSGEKEIVVIDKGRLLI